LIETAPKPFDEILAALKGFPKIGVAGGDGGSGRRSRAWASAGGGHESMGNRDYPVYSHLTICKKLLFVGWHYICL
jgi:ABC-type glycerol-3-phosphate transport system substrate-binding protein